VDVGITTVTSPAEVARLCPEGSRRREVFARRGSLIVGDVHPEVEAVAGALTPVPGGVGPLTVSMVLSNTIAAAERRHR
jgi:methylenetetrahydrofolate dehydrogenase (NADP+)/methenyltetrahydrofolate cyclohydrolase